MVTLTLSIHFFCFTEANNTSKQTGFALGEGLGKAVGQATAWMIAGIIWIILALASLIILLLLVGNEKVIFLLKRLLCMRI